jgi:hypothetical protein
VLSHQSVLCFKGQLRYHSTICLDLGQDELNNLSFKIQFCCFLNSQIVIDHFLLLQSLFTLVPKVAGWLNLLSSVMPSLSEIM